MLISCIFLIYLFYIVLLFFHVSFAFKTKILSFCYFKIGDKMINSNEFVHDVLKLNIELYLYNVETKRIYIFL